MQLGLIEILCFLFLRSTCTLAKKQLQNTQSLAAILEPKVKLYIAFVCGKPAMYFDNGKWMPDFGFSCPDSPEKIVQYCQNVYRHHNITNARPLSHLEIIKDWPDMNGKVSSKSSSITTRPFLCTNSKTQVDNLLVPKNCHFSHIVNEQACEHYKTLIESAQQTCSKQYGSSWIVNSYGLLFECRGFENFVMHFNGIEFVCCDGVAHEDPIINHPIKSIQSIYKTYTKSGKHAKSFKEENANYVKASEAFREVFADKELVLEKHLSDAENKLKPMWIVDKHEAFKAEETLFENFKKRFRDLRNQEASEYNSLELAFWKHIRNMLFDRIVEKLEKLDKLFLQKRHTIEQTKDLLNSLIQDIVRLKVQVITTQKYLKLETSFATQDLKLIEGHTNKLFDMLEENLEPKNHNLIHTSKLYMNSIFDDLKNQIEREIWSHSNLDPSKDALKRLEFTLMQYKHYANVNSKGEAKSVSTSRILQGSSKKMDENLKNLHHKQKTPQKSFMYYTIGLIGVIFAMGSFLVVMILVRTNRSKKQQKFTQVSTNPSQGEPSSFYGFGQASIEDELHEMQVNGYENPTYKYFDIQKSVV